MNYWGSEVCVPSTTRNISCMNYWGSQVCVPSTTRNISCMNYWGSQVCVPSTTRNFSYMNYWGSQCNNIKPKGSQLHKSGKCESKGFLTLIFLFLHFCPTEGALINCLFIWFLQLKLNIDKKVPLA